MEVRNLIENEKSEVSFEILCEGSEWAAYLKKTAAQFQKQKPVPGYRAGKAALPVAAKFYGKALFEAASREATNELMGQVLVEHNFTPVTYPSFIVITSDLSKLEFICRFVNYPTLKELKYKGLEAEKPVRHATDADVDKAIDAYMRQHLYVHEVERPAQMEDIVELSFTASCGEESFSLDHSEKFRLRLGSGILFAGLDELLVGKTKGEDLETTLTMPEDFHRDDIAGKAVDLKVHVRGVWARDLLECTDEYVKEKVKGFDTLEQFREHQRETIQKRYDKKSEEEYIQNLETVLANEVKIEIPSGMVDTALVRHVNGLRNIAQQQGKTAEQALKEEGLTMDDFINMRRPLATLQVKKSIALDYIIQNENLTIDQAELDRYFERNAKAAEVTVEEMKRRMGGEDEVRDQMLSDRAFEIVKENAKPILKEVTEE